MNRSRYLAAAGDEVCRGVFIYAHHRRAAEQPAKLQRVALFALWDYAHGGRFLIYHADRGLVGYDRGDRLLGRVLRDRDHIEPHRADRGHRFELFQI